MVRLLAAAAANDDDKVQCRGIANHRTRDGDTPFCFLWLLLLRWISNKALLDFRCLRKKNRGASLVMVVDGIALFPMDMQSIDRSIGQSVRSTTLPGTGTHWQEFGSLVGSLRQTDRLELPVYKHRFATLLRCLARPNERNDRGIHRNTINHGVPAISKPAAIHTRKEAAIATALHFLEEPQWQTFQNNKYYRMPNGAASRPSLSRRSRSNRPNGGRPR